MEAPVPGTSKNCSLASPGIGTSRSRVPRARKRKRLSSESSSDNEPVLPENTLEVEKNLHASAIKNNLDDVSVKKILKKVVTNDHVLALVKLREEEENMAMKKDNLQPKLTRAKVKELMKMSPNTAWDLDKMELTPIKHIPVKTRPEVTALIAQELPEDEDDEEYEPTHDDVPSDDDHTLESCSDADSQPRTPATPRSAASPRVLQDGPFKIPQDVSTPRRKLNMDEDATIALRTRSKLSLSSIPIDHIESSFVPPDELPMPAADDVWTQFLQVCLNPETERDVDDDDDPEYNVAADQDAHDEDEEGIENIMKISKKELNDLVTELFNVMPEGLGDDVLSGKLASEVPAPSNEQIPSTQWEGKQEPVSDEETTPTALVIQTKEKRLSIGKSELISDTECQDDTEKENRQNNREPPIQVVPKEVTVKVVEGKVCAHPAPESVVPPPLPLQSLLITKNTLLVQVQNGAEVLPEQIEILQQQLRQHVQLATSNFLQLFVHPVHWSLAPTYKEYLETLNNFTLKNPKSVANVCNLKSAWDLVNSWEDSVSADTPENAEMVKFVHKQIERGRRRAAQNNLYVGDFHHTFMKVVANSSVFLYPHLLPPLPYRSDICRKFSYLRCEDELITLGIDEFWQYVEDNPDLYPPKPINKEHRWGLINTVYLVVKHMFPWMPPKALLSHIQHIRKHKVKNKDQDNPINRFFDKREVTPVKHVLLPYNPNLTLYEQPEYEMPRIWVRYLAKSSKRFRDHLYRRTGLNRVTGHPPPGVPVDIGAAVQPPTKKPLPISFTKEITATRPNMHPPDPPSLAQDKYDLELTQPAAKTQDLLYSVVQTSNGAYLIPLSIFAPNTDSATSNSKDVASKPEESDVPHFSVTVPIKNYTPVTNSIQEPVPNHKEVLSSEQTVPVNVQNTEPPVTPNNHCPCCILLRKISKQRQSLITDFFKKPKQITCPCKKKRELKYPKVSKKLRLLVNNYKCKSFCTWQTMISRAQALTSEIRKGVVTSIDDSEYNLDEIAAVTSFQLKLTIRTSVARDNFMKRKIHTLLSKFDPNTDNPTYLINKLEKILATECVDMYKESLSFLTMEQADKIGKFLDYFKQDSLDELLKKIEELVSNIEHKERMLTRIAGALRNAKQRACELCVAILGAVKNYPALAEYVFSLFPHRRQKEPISVPKQIIEAKKVCGHRTDSTDTLILENIDTADPIATDNIEDKSIDPLAIDNTGDRNTDPPAEDNVENGGANPPVTENIEDETICDESQAMDYEADHSSSDDDTLTIVENSAEINQTQDGSLIHDEFSSDTVTKTPFLTVTKTEVQECSETDMSMLVMSEDDFVKTEPPEWRRDEDKLLLEVLQPSLTPEKMNDMSILEIIEQKKVLQSAAQNLPDKSLDDVRQRILYLLEFLVLNEQ